MTSPTPRDDSSVPNAYTAPQKAHSSASQAFESASDAPRGEGAFPKFFRAFLTWAIHLFVTLCLIGWMSSLHYLTDYYTIHDSRLPTITQRMFSLTLLNRDYWYLLFFAAIVLNGPLAIGLQFLPPRYRWVRVVWFDGYLLFAVTMLTAGTFVMLIPLAKMLQDGAAP